MFRDITNTIDALNDINASINNNKVSKKQIERLSAGLLSDNIDTSESIQTRFNPNLYSNSPSAISIDDAKYVVDRIEGDIKYLADNNRRESLTLAIDSISTLLNRINHITNLKDPDLDKLKTIKDYFSRPKKKFDVYGGELKEDIECEFIPLEIFDNRDQLQVFKAISMDCSEANYLFEAIYSQSPVKFYPFLNWIFKALKDPEITKDTEYNWRMLFENDIISPIDLSLIFESIIDGRLKSILSSLKIKLEEELTYVVTEKIDALKTISLTTKKIEKYEELDSFRYASTYDKMYKDKISLMFIEFLYMSEYSKSKQ